MASSKLFQDPKYAAYTLEGGEGAALLVHGFPGTPAELRPLGEALHEAGWAVRGLLLPGFGAEFESLRDRKAGEWQAAVEATLLDLQQKYPFTLLVGYSMGGGLCMHAAARLHPSGLVLLAPFWRATGWFWASLPVLIRIFPTIKPFRFLRMNISGSNASQGAINFLPEMDLNDPQARKALEDFEFPTGAMKELRQVGIYASKAAPGINLPTLVLQGADDRAVQPGSSRYLLQILPGPFSYQEAPAGHDLIDPNGPAWPEIRRAVVKFADTISSESQADPGRALSR